MLLLLLLLMLLLLMMLLLLLLEGRWSIREESMNAQASTPAANTIPLIKKSTQRVYVYVFQVRHVCELIAAKDGTFGKNSCKLRFRSV